MIAVCHSVCFNEGICVEALVEQRAGGHCTVTRSNSPAAECYHFHF